MITRFKTRVTTGLLAACVAVFGSATVVIAQSSSDVSADLIETIRARCSNSQFALQQIEKRDAVSRINRGRSYDQMLRQVSAFNSRFTYNKINEPKLVEITSSLQKGVDEFRASYDHYDTDISDALKVNCRDKPAEYYAVIVRAREDRNTVGQQVQKIEQLMQDYRAAVAAYGEAI